MNDQLFYFDFYYTDPNGIDREEEDVLMTQKQAYEHAFTLEQFGFHTISYERSAADD